MKNIDRLCPNCMKESDGQHTCPHCGFVRPEEHDPAYLHIGTRIMKRYLVGAPISSNNEAITYICFDGDTEKTVWLREYFPHELCIRNEKGAVVPREGAEEELKNGKASFAELSDKLRQHSEISAILKVTEAFEGNGTSYCITESTDAITLREFLLRNGGALTWEQTAPLIMPFLSSVVGLHAAGIYHYGISPETVLVTRDGRLLLTEHCTPSVRTADGAVTAQLFPGFAAVEQYGSIGTCGAHTDVYALAAVLYRILVGNPPVEAITRVSNDTLIIPQRLASSVPKEVTEALAEGLQIMPEERMQTVEEMRLLLAEAGGKASKRKSGSEKKNGRFKSYMLLTTVMTVLVMAAAAALLYIFVLMPSLNGGNSSVPPVISSGSSVDESSSDTASTGTVKIDSFLGKTYTELIEDPTIQRKYNIVIDSKKYSESYQKGKIISQSPDAGKLADPSEDGRVTVRVVISLGNYQVSMPDVTGLDKDTAVFELMKAGFDYENITVNEVYDISAKPSAVISTTPAPGERVNLDSTVTLTFNSYAGTSSEE